MGMPLSAHTQKALQVGLTKTAGKEVATAIAAGGAAAENVPLLGTLATVVAPLGAVPNVSQDGVAALAADVDSTFEDVSDKIDALIGGTDARIATVQAKLDALIQALVDAALMDGP